MLIFDHAMAHFDRVLVYVNLYYYAKHQAIPLIRSGDMVD